jgi:CubicO group peptidase (beta-lactamase class C family)
VNNQSKMGVEKSLEGFDEAMAKVLEDWNVPGFGVGIVIEDELVLARGYGYRDYEQKLPFTPQTLCPIASNTKLFTAVAVGMVVEEGKLTWDKPVSEAVPAMRFQNDDLTQNVTVRDMLSHRTGITRHDSMWYKSDFTRAELFHKLRFMEPQAPLRTQYLYNNLMYAAVGYLIELQTGKTWETFLRERILEPLGMDNTCFAIAEMQQKPDFGVPFTERRDSFDLYRIPYYEEMAGVAPCGAMISNIEEMAHWVTSLLNDGKFQDTQIIPASVLNATMEPAIAIANPELKSKGYREILHPACGMGRRMLVYRGHLLTYHGGAINGFRSQVSMMPHEKIGVMVFVIGDHAAPIHDAISFNIYERLLGMAETPWLTRRLEERLENKKAGTEMRAKAGSDRIPDTRPSHALADYAAEYENEAYGTLKIKQHGDQLQFDFHKLIYPLTHYHYDRFDTPDDEYYGKFSVNFSTNPQGDVDRVTMSLDEAEVVFTRRPETLETELLQQFAGEYILPDKSVLTVKYTGDAELILIAPPAPQAKLIPYKGSKFRHQQFSDVLIEFVMNNDSVQAVKYIRPSGEQVFPRKTS